ARQRAGHLLAAAYLLLFLRLLLILGCGGRRTGRSRQGNCCERDTKKVHREVHPQRHDETTSAWIDPSYRFRRRWQTCHRRKLSHCPRGGFSRALRTPRMVRTSRWFQPGFVSIERKVRRVAAARLGGRKKPRGVRRRSRCAIMPSSSSCGAGGSSSSTGGW